MRTHEIEQSRQGDLLVIPKDIGTIALASALWEAGVPVDRWDQGYAKAVKDLKQEIERGKSELLVANGRFLRHVRLVWLDVLYCPPGGDRYILREDRQEFINGNARKRNLPASLGEKMLSGETQVEAVQRALQEEIGVGRMTHCYSVGDQQETFFRYKDYPGLDNLHVSTRHVVVIPDDQFKPGGYIEYQQEKTNFYMWDKM